MYSAPAKNLVSLHTVLHIWCVYCINNNVADNDDAQIKRQGEVPQEKIFCQFSFVGSTINTYAFGLFYINWRTLYFIVNYYNLYKLNLINYLFTFLLLN